MARAAAILILCSTLQLLPACSRQAESPRSVQDYLRDRRVPSDDVASVDSRACPDPDPPRSPPSNARGAAAAATVARTAPEAPRGENHSARRPIAPARPDDHRDAVAAPTLHVNDETISVADILEPLESRLDDVPRHLPPDLYYRKIADLVRMQIVEAVAQHLIWRKARQQITEELEPQLDKAVDKMEKDRINREFDGRETEYERYLAGHGRSREDVRQRLRRAMVIDSYLRERLLPLVAAPRKNELWDYYQSHPEEFSTPQRREMLLIDIPIAAYLDVRRPLTREDEARARQAARQDIDAAMRALRAGEPFEQVARKYSHGPNKDAGGNWGFITAPSPGQAPLQGHWEAPSRRLFELAEGQASEIIEAAKSFFIVKVGRIEGGGTKSFQDAQPEIAAILRQQRFNKLRADFLQRQLDESTIGSLEDFVAAVMKEIPESAAEARAGNDAPISPSRSRPRRAKTDKPAPLGPRM